MNGTKKKKKKSDNKIVEEIAINSDGNPQVSTIRIAFGDKCKVNTKQIVLAKKKKSLTDAVRGNKINAKNAIATWND